MKGYYYAAFLKIKFLLYTETWLLSFHDESSSSFRNVDNCTIIMGRFILARQLGNRVKRPLRLGLKFHRRQCQLEKSVSPHVTKSFSTSNVVASSRKLLVVLDIDETLIHSRFRKGENLAHQVERDETKSSSNPNSPSNEHSQQEIEQFQMFIDPDHVGYCVYVNKRPGLDEFLEYLRLQKKSGNIEVSVFTAGMKIYGEAILRHLDPDASLFEPELCFYRTDCTPLANFYSKDLNHCLRIDEDDYDSTKNINPTKSEVYTPDLSSVVLVDNNPLSFTLQPDNGSLIESFFEDPSDTELETLTGALDNLVADVQSDQDVRKTLQTRFDMQAQIIRLLNLRGKGM